MRARVRQIWDKLRQRVRGVGDSFSVSNASPVTLTPLANDQGSGLRITHVNNRLVVQGEVLDFSDFEVTVSGNELSVEALNGYTGPVHLTYRFTDGRTSGVAEIVGEFVA